MCKVLYLIINLLINNNRDIICLSKNLFCVLWRRDDFMKKYLPKIIIILLQIFVLYLFPFAFKYIDQIIVIVGIFLAVFGLSMMIVIVSKNKIKYFYSILVSIMYVTSIPLFYNDSAFGNVVWYFAISSGGLLLGFLIDKFVDSVYNNR